jgi:hypothetical protein
MGTYSTQLISASLVVCQACAHAHRRSTLSEHTLLHMCQGLACVPGLHTCAQVQQTLRKRSFTCARQHRRQWLAAGGRVGHAGAHAAVAVR